MKEKKLIRALTVFMAGITVLCASNGIKIYKNSNNNVIQDPVKLEDEIIKNEEVNYKVMPKNFDEREKIMKDLHPNIIYSYIDGVDESISYAVYTGVIKDEHGQYTVDNNSYGDLNELKDFDYYQIKIYNEHHMIGTNYDGKYKDETLEMQLNDETINVPLRYAVYGNYIEDVIKKNIDENKENESYEEKFSLYRMESSYVVENNVASVQTQVIHIDDFDSLKQLGDNEYPDGKYSIEVYNKMYKGVNIVDGKYILDSAWVYNINDLYNSAYYIETYILQDTYSVNYPEEKIKNL